MPTDEQRALLHQFVAGLNGGDVAVFDRLLSPDFFGYKPVAGEPTAPEAFRQVSQDLRAAFPDLQVSLEEVTEAGDELRGRMTLRGTFTGPLWGVPGDGRAYAVTETASARFAGGRLALRWEEPKWVGVLREMGVVPKPETAHLKPEYPARVPEIILRLAWNGQRLQEKECAHLNLIQVTEPAADVCQQCVESGDEWPALRMCVVCGFVGCCDMSVNKHMKKHFEATGHPIFRSIQPGEAWMWCYADSTFLSSRHLPA